MNLKFTRKLLVLGATLFLATRVFAMDTNAVSATADVATPGVTREEVSENYLHIQEQIHEAQLAIEQNQKASAEAAAEFAQSNAAALTARLESLERSVANQRTGDAEAAHKTQETTLFMAGSFGVIGLGVMLLMVYFQWRAFTQLAQISAHQNASYATTNGVHQLAAPGRAAVEAANAQLLGVVGRLEQRINELEGGQRFLPELPVTKSVERIERLERAVVVAPPTDLLGEGQKHLDAGLPLKALECFDKYLSTHPERADALVKRAAALEKLGREDEAVETYNRAISADSTLVIAHLHKGGLLNRLRRYDEALNCYEQALQAQEKKAVAK
jgi:tetratricopeptide (TPR) repeat protein